MVSASPISRSSTGPVVCALRASSQAPRSWAAISCSPVWAESSPQASRNECSTAASPVQARSRRRLARIGLAPGERPEDLVAGIPGGRAVLGDEHHLDPVAGAEVEDLGRAELRAQRDEAYANFRARQ